MSKAKHYSNAYRRQLKKTIENLPTQVFSRKDLTQGQSHSEQQRLTRALNVFIDEGTVVKVSHGVYVKATLTAFSDGKKTPLPEQDFESIAMDVLDKLGVRWELGGQIQAYNRGDISQVPVIFEVRLKSRFRGAIQLGRRKVFFERGINAR